MVLTWVRDDVVVGSLVVFFAQKSIATKLLSAHGLLAANRPT